MHRVGVFGGTFDPVHLGHLIPAVRALETFRLDALTFIPAGRPPHKQGETIAPFSHRFAMLALATHPYERFFVSDLELEGDQPTYTVATLRRFRTRCPADQLYFLLGSDSFSQINTWHRWEELVDLVHLIVLHRATVWGEALLDRVPPALHARLRNVEPFAEVPDPPAGAKLIYLLDHEPFPVSATHLRERLRRGRTIGELVPPEVHRYIVKYKLYYGDEGAESEG
jgi:nicotinate-nucleotide adenylyltransferase